MSGPATPLAPASARASLPPTGSATPALPAQPAMPRPEDFDILPDLHKLISSVARPDNRDAHPDQSQTPSQAKGDGEKLRVEDVPEQAATVRGKIHRARAAIMALPDMDRSLEDQQEEMADLEAHIARLKVTLHGLGQPTNGRFDQDEDSSMTG